MTLRSLLTLRGLLAACSLSSALALGACPSSTPAANAPSPPGSSYASSSSAAPVDSAAVSSLDLGEREIGAAAGDCGRACEGLTRVARARKALCLPRSSACAEAEGREAAARARVGAFCEPCGDAP
jgi:ABC-type oligopeptide transport system substrate-binding subunit